MRPLIERDLATAGALLDGRQQSLLMPLARFAAASQPAMFDALADWSATLAADIADLARWQAVASLLLTGSGTLRKTVDKRCGFPADKAFAEHKKAMLELLADLRATPGLEEALGVLVALPQPQLSEAEWATVECFSRPVAPGRRAAVAGLPGSRRGRFHRDRRPRQPGPGRGRGADRPGAGPRLQNPATCWSTNFRTPARPRSACSSS